MSRLILIFILTIATDLCLYGQSYAIYNYSIAEGLPSNEVYEVFQDRDGFIWFATDNGVVKYNGREMEVFNIKEGLSDPVVFGFNEDHKGRIWFRTYSGALTYYEEGVIKKHSSSKSLPNIPYTIYCDPNNDIWIAGLGYLGVIQQQEIKLEPLKSRSLTYKTINKGHLLASNFSNRAINEIIIDGQNFPVAVTDTSIHNSSFSSQSWQGSLLLSIGLDIFRYDGQRLTKVYTSKKPIISMATDRHDNLWIGYYSGGVERFSKSDFTKPWRLPALENKSVTGILHDNEGGYWFSTLEKGAFTIPSLTIENSAPDISSKIQAVAAVDNHLIIGDFTGSIYMVDPAKGKIKSRVTAGSYLNTIYVDRSKKIHVSGSQSITYSRQFSPEITEPVSIHAFHENATGELWGIGEKKLTQHDRHGRITKVIELPGNYRTLYAHDSVFFLGGNIGLHVISGNGKILKSIKELSNAKVNNIQEFNDSTIFISTSNAGFFLLANKSHNIIYHSQHKLFANNIYCSVITDSVLWLGTEKGLAFISLGSLAKQEFSFVYLSKKNGLTDNFVNHIALVRDRIFAFSDYAYSSIPVSFPGEYVNPRFYLKQTFINGKPVNSLSSRILKPNENNIEINFGYISFQNPNILMRYRLNSQEPWIYSNTTKLQLSSLAPGDYSFQLQFSIDNIHWKDALAAIPLLVESAWWGSWYTYTGAVILLCVISFVHFRNVHSGERNKNRYLRIMNEHQQKLIQSEIVALERERTRLAKELHDGVGTNLTAIRLMISQLLKNNQGPVASDIEEQFQIAIEEIKDIIYGLTPPSLQRYGLFTALKNYIAKLNKNIPIKISVQAYGEEINDYELNIIIFRILQELLSNSIKHSYAKNIRIHLNSFDDLLNIVYEDDGIGFNYNPGQTGLGLDSVESRISSINGILKFESGSFGVSYNIDIPLTFKTNVA